MYLDLYFFKYVLFIKKGAFTHEILANDITYAALAILFSGMTSTSGHTLMQHI